jgi:hypothetical protein
MYERKSRSYIFVSSGRNDCAGSHAHHMSAPKTAFGTLPGTASRTTILPRDSSPIFVPCGTCTSRALVPFVGSA